jgi:hypothetical protein
MQGLVYRVFQIELLLAFEKVKEGLIFTDRIAVEAALAGRITHRNGIIALF